MEEGSIYSFTSYNSTHYSDSNSTYRSNRKTNSFLYEINQKVKEDSLSLVDMEEGIIALSNFLNGVEEKRPSVSELIGSRINLDECLKLKLQIREKIRQTRTIRKDLFISTSEKGTGTGTGTGTGGGGAGTSQLSPVLSPIPDNHMSFIAKGRSSPPPPMLIPQTSRVSTSHSNVPTPSAALSPSSSSISRHQQTVKPKELNESKGEGKSKVNTQKTPTHFDFNESKVLKSSSSATTTTTTTTTTAAKSITTTVAPATTSISTSASAPKLPISSSSSFSMNDKSQLEPIERPFKTQNLSIQNQTSSSISTHNPTPLVPLVTPILSSSSSSSSHKRKPLIPVDDLADRQVAWLLSIEAKNRLAKQALETQTMREVIILL